MSVNTYLDSLSSKLVLSESDKNSINISIESLKNRINYYFSNVDEHFKFGSSLRFTILPRKADSDSDIDYMIVFETRSATYKPQTYLDRLKAFVGVYYSSSEIYQSNPAIVLELNHIKFDLVPAIKLWPYNNYQIPSTTNYSSDWISTDPNGLNDKLTAKNVIHNSQIKPLIRLVKYWNALNGRPFPSYSLENSIIDMVFYSCNSVKDYFYYFWANFAYNYNTAEYIKDKVIRAKKKVQNIKNCEDLGFSEMAERELKDFLPEF